MEPRPEVIARAMASRPLRLAVFDIGLRQRTGQWYLKDPVPCDQTFTEFAELDEFEIEPGVIQVPLHESHSAALTDEYLRVDLEAGIVQFFDPGVKRAQTISIDDFTQTYPAWRMRFWTSAFQIVDPPPFIHEFGDMSGDSPTLPPGPGEPSSVLDTDAFFEAVRSTLVAIRESQREEIRSRYSFQRREEFIEEFGGILGLVAGGRTIDDYGQQVIQLAIPESHPLAGATGDTIRASSRLGEGDEVIIDSPESDALPVEAELFEVNANGFELGIYWDSARGNRAEEAFEPDRDHSLLIGRLVDGKQFSVVADAIDVVDRTDFARERYAGIPESEPRPPVDIESVMQLNRDQLRAIRYGSSAGLMCIQAPPWTGVRRTIIELVRGAVHEGDRVLLLVPEPGDLDRLLEGDASTDAWSMKEVAEAESIHVEILRNRVDAFDANADVVVMPVAAAVAIDDHSMDLAIVDQAARIDVPTGAIPFAKAGRVVLIGDSWQGAATTAERATDHGLAESIFAHLRSSSDDRMHMLRSQYRMNQTIARFSNTECYNGQLLSGGRNRSWSIDSLAPIAAIHVPADTQTTPTGSVYHDAEIEHVLAEVDSLLRRGVERGDIGILTPYSAQIGKIRVALNEMADQLGDDILVGGIDQFRCVHRSAVIISFVGASTPDADMLREMGHLGTDTGLNIAMTRASKRLVLIGDWNAINARGGMHASLASFLVEEGCLEPEDIA